MEVIQVRPKGIFVTLEFAIEELKAIAGTIDEIRAKTKSLQIPLAHEYVAFHRLAKQLTEDNKDGPR